MKIDKMWDGSAVHDQEERARGVSRPKGDRKRCIGGKRSTRLRGERKRCKKVRGIRIRWCKIKEREGKCYVEILHRRKRTENKKEGEG